MWSSRLAPLFVAALLSLVGCDGDGDDDGNSDGADIPVHQFREPANLTSDLIVRVDGGGNAGDEEGTWLGISVHIENNSEQRSPFPGFNLRCSGSNDALGERLERPGDEPPPRHIAAGARIDTEVNLLLPGETRSGDVVPACKGPAYVEATTPADDGERSTVRWALDEQLLEDVNASRRKEAAPQLPPEPDRDPDRPYAWIDTDPYSSGHHVILVPNMTPAEALRVLGPVRRRVDPEEQNPEAVTVAALRDDVVIFTYYGFIPDGRVLALSRGGIAASYSNTVNGDEHVLVARDGKVVRSFDPFLEFNYVKTKPLPEEKGLDLAEDTGPASWTLLERLTSIHVTEEWLWNGSHAAYLLTD